jgi:hypothetical protein
MRRLFAMGWAAGLLSVAEAGVFIEFTGDMYGSWGAQQAWHQMVPGVFAWQFFYDCEFVATSSNAEFLQGKDLSKLKVTCGKGGLATPNLTWFWKPTPMSDHRLYTEGAFEIAYDGVKLVEGSSDIEVDVQYNPSLTAGAINGQIVNLFAGPVLSGSDFADAFNGENDNNQWKATILTMSNVFQDHYVTTIRLESQPVERRVRVILPELNVPVVLDDVGVGLNLFRITDAGGGHVSVVQKLAAPEGALPPSLDPLTVAEHWAIGATLVDFAANLALAYNTNLLQNVERLRVFRRESAANPWEAMAIAAAGDGWVTVTNVTHFSEWIVGALANNDPTLPVDLPAGVSEADRLMYRNWIDANKVAWGASDFSAVPAEDFLAAWLVGQKPVSGYADSVALKITAFEPVATQPAETNAMPIAWRAGAAGKPEVVRVTLSLLVGGVPWTGPVNGNVLIQCAEALAGPWTRSSGQLDAEARLTFSAGVADLIFNQPPGAEFYRPALSREGRVGPTGRLAKWGTVLTTQWLTSTIDGLSTNGLHASLAFNAAGVLGVCYYDATARDLKYASYADGVLHVERVDTAGDVGEYCDLAFAPSGLPAISYYDATLTQLKYAAYDGTHWIIQTVDTNEYSGLYTSLAFTTNGYPAISYQSQRNYRELLKYAVYTGATWSNQVVDAAYYSGYHTSLAFAANGRPAIAYAEDNNSYVYYAAFNGTSWATPQNTYLRYASEVSLTFTTNGYPAIAMYDWMYGQLCYSAKDQLGWGAITYVETFGVGSGASFVSQAVAPDLRPALSYYDPVNGDLKYAKHNGSAWVRETVDSVGSVGLHASLAFSPKGRPTIAYYDKTNGRLKIAEQVPVMRVVE